MMRRLSLFSPFYESQKEQDKRKLYLELLRVINNIYVVERQEKPSDTTIFSGNYTTSRLQNLYECLEVIRIRPGSRPSITALVHMTLLIDTYFRLNPFVQLSLHNYQNLFVTSLYIACKYNDKKMTEHNEFWFADYVQISSSKLNEMEAVFLSAINNQVRYQSSELIGAGARFSRECEAYLKTKHVVVELEHKAALPMPDYKEYTPEELDQVITRIAAVLDALRISSEKLMNPGVKNVAELPISIKDYLNRFREFADGRVENFVQMLMIFDQYIVRNKDDLFGNSNCYFRIMMAFILAYKFNEDRVYPTKYLLKVGMVYQKNENATSANTFSLVEDAFCASLDYQVPNHPELYGEYLRYLLPSAKQTEEKVAATALPPEIPVKIKVTDSSSALFPKVSPVKRSRNAERERQVPAAELMVAPPSP